MNTPEILQTRQINQQLLNPVFKTPADVVSHLGAMQAQEYAMAKWAIGLRCPDATDASVEKAFNDGKIIRTHLLRPTWHFVAPSDLRWMLALTAPHVHRLNNPYYKQVVLDSKTLTKTTNLIAKILEGKNFLSRNEIKERLASRKIYAEGMRLAYALMYAELEGVICSGPRKGKQFTYALIEERVKAAKKKISREEALMTLMTRFFESRGPASLKDFCYWSGLKLGESKVFFDEVGRGFASEIIAGEKYLFREIKKPATDLALRTFLMPTYDEYGMGYKDRSLLAYPKLTKPSPFNRMIIVDGRVAGGWERKVEKGEIVVNTVQGISLTKKQSKDVQKAVNEFKSFATPDEDLSEEN